MDVADFTCLYLNKYIRKKKIKKNLKIFKLGVPKQLPLPFCKDSKRDRASENLHQSQCMHCALFSPSLRKVDESPEQALFGPFKAIFIAHKIFKVSCSLEV